MIGTLFVWLINFALIGGIITSLIYMYRASQDHDTAAEDLRVLKEGQRTLIERIERCRSQLEKSEGRAKNYIVYNHTRNEIIEDALGYVTREGAVKITGAPLKIDPQYVAREVQMLIILRDGEASGLF